MTTTKINEKIEEKIKELDKSHLEYKKLLKMQRETNEILSKIKKEKLKIIKKDLYKMKNLKV